MDACAACGREAELFEYQGQDLCTDLVTRAAEAQPKYSDAPKDSKDTEGRCDNCREVYGVLIPGKFGDWYCEVCLSTRYLERGEGYRLTLWNSWFLAHGGH